MRMKQYLAVEDFGPRGTHSLVFSSLCTDAAEDFARCIGAEFCGEITESYVVRERDLMTDRHHAWKKANGIT